MNYAQIKAHFLDHLDRSDCTDAQADRYLTEAADVIQRVLRVPSLERYERTTIEQATDRVLIPADFMETIGVFVNDREIAKGTVGQLMRLPTQGRPTHYTRVGGDLIVRGSLLPGDEIVIWYYGEISPVDGAGENELTSFAPDLWRFRALADAGDFYNHEKTADWEGQFSGRLDTIRQQAMDTEWSGGTLQMASVHQGTDY